MENSNMIIRIPEPCHEDWNKMIPDEKGLPTGQAGKFCNSCSKSVFDFSNKTDSEIKDILLAHKDQKVCGHFKKTQINRPLNFTIDLNDLPKNMSVTKMFTIALFISFGTFLFSCTDNLGKTVGEISVTEPIKTEMKDELNQLLGEVAATVPPDSIIEVEKIDNVETIDGEIVPHYQTHVAGGISIQHDYVIESILPTDSPVVDSPIVAVSKAEDMIVGMMVYIPEIKNSIIPLNPLDTITIHKVDEKEVNDITSDFIVFPNPNKGEFTIKYDLKKRSDVFAEIVNISGVVVRTLVNIQGQHTGKYQVPVDLSDLINGIYFVNLTNEGKRRTQKVVLQK